jgi:hypothetical protein
MATESTKIKRQRFTKWAAFVGVGLILCLLVGERYAPRYFGGASDMIAGLLGAALIIGWLIDRVLWPLAVHLLSVLALCGAALVVAFWALLGLLNVAGAAWRGELGPLSHEDDRRYEEHRQRLVEAARARGEYEDPAG